MIDPIETQFTTMETLKPGEFWFIDEEPRDPDEIRQWPFVPAESEYDIFADPDSMALYAPLAINDQLWAEAAEETLRKMRNQAAG